MSGAGARRTRKGVRKATNDRKFADAQARRPLAFRGRALSAALGGRCLRLAAPAAPNPVADMPHFVCSRCENSEYDRESFENYDP